MIGDIDIGGFLWRPSQADRGLRADQGQCVAAFAGISDMQSAAAASATEQTRQQSFAAPDSPAAQIALSVGIVGDQTLIPFELLRGNICLVMVADQTSQSFQFRRILSRTTRFLPPSIKTRVPRRPKTNAPA